MQVADWVQLSEAARKAGVKSKRPTPWLVANVRGSQVEVVKVSKTGRAWIDIYHESFLEVVKEANRE